MRIAITSAFHPSIGGIETVADLLAREFVAAGHGVEIIASNRGPATPPAGFPFPISYRPGSKARLDVFRRVDCVLQFNIGLRALWPNFLVGRPVVVVQEGIFDPRDLATTTSDRFKHLISGQFATIAASSAVARSLRGPATVIPNCFDPAVFHSMEAAPRERDIVCVGRLIRDKGADLLLDAVAELRGRNLFPSVTIVGDGVERRRLQEQASRLAIAGQVVFAGSLPREQVAAEFRRHRIAVTPSRYEEAFGIVVLEAAACGCHVVAAARGGLPEAVGPCGLLFEPNRAGDLAARLEVLLAGKDDRASPESRERHLRQHTPSEVSRRYLAVLGAAIGSGGAQKAEALRP